MARGGGLALRSLAWVLRAIEFGCAGVVLGFFAYFLAELDMNSLAISNYTKAVTGISGVAVIYTIFAILLVCCLGGFAFFSFAAIVLDLAFVGGFIFIAYETRDGAHSCSGFINTPLGSGIAGVTQTIGSLPSLRTTCRMNTACFAVAVAAAVLFLLSALIEVALWRHHQSEKKYGPGPSNNYSEGSGSKRIWHRKPKTASPEALAATSALATEKRHPDALPVHSTPADVRTSYATDNTMVGPEPVVYNKYGHIGNGGVGDGYAAPTHNHMGTDYNETARLPADPYNYQTSGVTGATEMPAARY